MFKRRRDTFLTILKRSSFIILLFAVSTFCGCSKEPGGDSTPAASIAGPRKTVVEPEADPLHPIVRLETTAGDIVLKLNAQQAPGTVSNFVDYVNEGFFAGTQFHYVDRGQMILGGGYTAEGVPKPTRLSIRNEAHNGLKNVRGSVAMARNADQIDSATTQFFINLTDTPSFDNTGDSAADYGYCVFGEVTEGLDVADQISQLATVDRGGDLFQSPKTAVVIRAAEVIR